MDQILDADRVVNVVGGQVNSNPSAMFARVERGETVQVTRHGKVIAVLLPAAGTLDRYSALVAKGLIRLNAMTDLVARFTEILLTEEVRDAAAHLPSWLRTLDAIHIASAQSSTTRSRYWSRTTSGCRVSPHPPASPQPLRA